jgi:mono/diheme cytochrome c family protein
MSCKVTTWIAICIVTATVSASVCSRSVLAQQNSAAAKNVWDGVYTQPQADRGKRAYTALCMGCHGEELDGQDMTPPLSGSRFLVSWDGEPLSELAQAVQTKMPANAPGSLTPDQVADLLAYVLSRNKLPTGQAELPKDTQSMKLITILTTKPTMQ